MGTASVTHQPQRDEDCEEADDMESQHHCFKRRQEADAVDIDAGGKGCRCDHEERCHPAFDLKGWIVQGDEGFDVLGEDQRI